MDYEGAAAAQPKDATPPPFISCPLFLERTIIAKLLLRRLIHSNAALRHVNPATATVSLPALLIGAVIIFSLLADRRAPFLNANLSTSSLASPSLPRPPARGGHPLSSAGFPRAATSSGATSGSPPTTTPGRAPELPQVWPPRPWVPKMALLRFDAAAFLDVDRGKSLAFVGDSLLCLLSKVAYPKDIFKKSHPEFRTLHYDSHDFTVSIFWSPFFEANKSRRLRRTAPDDAGFSYVVLSASNWFTRPSIFHDAADGPVVGCHYCLLPGVVDLTLRYSQRMAFRTALRALLTAGDGEFYGRTVVVRTVSPTSHFEGGEWDKGGDCRRTRPYAANETTMAGLDLDFHTHGAGGGAEAARVRLTLMDTTAAMLLRPDGHPSRHGHWAREDVTLYNDRVHWCLPGPIDVWNEMVFQMLLPD
ncbi:hypothetical protein HU200_049332 [Digitaria exilis]|uniref:Trichome birefringence-like C-terminal domain-containing protein n=1 Tax=Digitaria exilis TaxID=1010633 RepID=A0A835EC52_9POAL|nr:hypothetical protein HU200_049332 [Digitaria exilis]